MAKEQTPEGGRELCQGLATLAKIVEQVLGLNS